METFNTVLRAVHRDNEERRDPLDIFREFIDHLGRSARRARGDDARPNERRVAK
jgi:hypothetical protein